MRDIKLKQSIPSQAPNYIELYVNGIKLGEYLGGKNKKYLNKEKWADEQIKNRNTVIDRNIDRLNEELKKWKKEKETINN